MTGAVDVLVGRRNVPGVRVPSDQKPNVSPAVQAVLIRLNMVFVIAGIRNDEDAEPLRIACIWYLAKDSAGLGDVVESDDDPRVLADQRLSIIQRQLNIINIFQNLKKKKSKREEKMEGDIKVEKKKKEEMEKRKEE